MSKSIIRVLSSGTKQLRPVTFDLSLQSKQLHNIPVKEVKIPTKWGFIAAKLWGDEQQRPIVGVHGWQDNAGTWDTLIPLLPKECSFLAIDFPGHGQSGWYPPGMHYYFWDWLRAINTIKNHFKWNKISLLAHSMGGIASTRYAALYPDTVDMLIAFENIMPEHVSLHDAIKKLPTNLQKLELAQELLYKEPPSYSYEEALQRWHLGTGKSVTMEMAPYLVNRGTKPSKNDPTKFYFSRDSRLKTFLFAPESHEFARTLVGYIKCPMLYIKAKDSNYACDDFTIEIRDLLSKIHDKYELHLVPGTHHVHLNNPEIVAPIVTQFLYKHKLIQEKNENLRIQNTSL